MVTTKKFRELALAFEGAMEQPHFERASFRVNKKIFATLDEHAQIAVLKFSDIDQSVFMSYDPKVIYAQPGGWGNEGWTVVELKQVKPEMLEDALTVAYCNAAPERMALKYRKEGF